MFRLFEYVDWPAEAPQSEHGEDEGEGTAYAHRDECPDKEESVGLANRMTHCVDYPHAGRRERPDEDDDVPGSPFGEHQRSVQPDDQEEYNNHERTPRHPALFVQEIGRHVERLEENREQRRDGKHYDLFHMMYSR